MSNQPAWFDNQPYGIGERVVIADTAAREEAGAGAGRVVGYDASGPRPGESFIRILVMPDGPTPAIVALPPAALTAEEGAPELGLARTLLVEMRQTLPPAAFEKLLAWLRSETCARIAADPATARKNIRLGAVSLPGFLLPALAQLAAAGEG